MFAKKTSAKYSFQSTEDNMKYPKKHVKDDFVMWWHFYIYLNCPKIEEFYSRFLRCFKIRHVEIIQKTPLFYLRNIRNALFFHFTIKSERKMGHFKYFEHRKVELLNYSHVINFKKKLNRNWNSSILGHFKILSKCYHMTKSSFTCFLGHFMLLHVP